MIILLSGTPPCPLLKLSGGCLRYITLWLSHYKQENDQELIQGKPASKRSGNNLDTSALQPQFRWPNEGLYRWGCKADVGYDPSVPQWEAGQLTNAIQIQKNDILRSVLTEILLTMINVSSRRWPAVREAYVSSMYKVEEDSLTWSGATQWALKRLSASQLALANSSTLSKQHKGRAYKFYNENSCNHESHHGIYKHNCAYCWRR